ncbi:MAG: M1 family aminopeptidase [Roseivirga sp.]
MKYLLSLLSLLMILSACDTPEVEKIALEEGVSLELAQYRKSVISSVNYKLEFRVPNAADQKIQSLETLTFNLTDVSQDILLDFRESADMLQFLEINGKRQDIVFDKEHIVLPADALIRGKNTVDITFYAGETSLNRKEEFLYTLFVPDRARTAFPCFDQPNLKATYELILDLPSNWTAIANAPVAISISKDGRKNMEFQKSDLISTYLFSFVAGEFERITENVGGREMTMLHRETDAEKVERNKEFIFYLHGASLKWLEDYTGIKYPFKKFDFALIPSFQYGGMEHVGAIQYRANSLFLDENPSQNQLLSRASLIAHETAHMWFGDLVTMDWFNDVWTKEVFANFMAAKMVNPNFPDINHELSFLVRHYPAAYGVDRTEGANPIRQELGNLNEAGQMYGAIIYNKAPIMMRQLEMLVGEKSFQEGMQEYLKTFANRNATWPDLINILDKKTEQDLKAWSEVWVNTAGRPTFDLAYSQDPQCKLCVSLHQSDESGKNRLWQQSFAIARFDGTAVKNLTMSGPETDVSDYFKRDDKGKDYHGLINAYGRGYGVFNIAQIPVLENWTKLGNLQKGVAMIDFYEQLLDGRVAADEYVELIKWIVVREKNQLLLNLVLGQLNRVYWSFLTPDQRNALAPDLERTLYHCMNDKAETPSQKKIFFNAFRNVTITQTNIDRLYNIWADASHARVAGLQLSENDRTSLAANIAIKDPRRAEEVLDKQLVAIENPDRQKRFEFLMPALSDDEEVRDAFFASLKDETNRQTESWVLGALGYLHHPLRTEQSQKYIPESLELLAEIQKTGDIFFPKRWLDQTLGNHNSAAAARAVREFLEQRPDYNAQLKMKILQAADMLFRSERKLSPAM